MNMLDERARQLAGRLPLEQRDERPPAERTASAELYTHLSAADLLVSKLGDSGKRGLLRYLANWRTDVARQLPALAPDELTDRLQEVRDVLGGVLTTLPAGTDTTIAAAVGRARDKLFNAVVAYTIQRATTAHRDRNVVETWRYECVDRDGTVQTVFHSDTRQQSDLFREAPWRERPLYR